MSQRIADLLSPIYHARARRYRMVIFALAAALVVAGLSTAYSAWRVSPMSDEDLTIMRALVCYVAHTRDVSTSDVWREIKRAAEVTRYRDMTKGQYLEARRNLIQMSEEGT